MELDKRIIEGKKPLFCLDTEEAKQFIGKEGYFTNHLGVFAHIRRIEKYMLTAIDEKAQSCFKDVDGVRWDWFLPTEWVKPEEPEKKYREYKDLGEFFDVTGLEIGDLIKLKFPGNNVAELLIVGSCDNGLFIGIYKYTFKQLFEMVEISISGEWQPFGIEE